MFLTPDEVEDYRRDKRRRLLEKHRDDRLRALSAADNDNEPEEAQDIWGESDEEVCDCYCVN
jgi:hypothetical protein